MKLLVVFGISFLVGLAASASTGRGCIYILGKCSRECEVGTHAYAIGCGFVTPEATCENPKPVADQRGMICDYSACYCDEPTVRDSVSGKCVPLDECPKKEDKKDKEESKDTEASVNQDSKQGKLERK